MRAELLFAVPLGGCGGLTAEVAVLVEVGVEVEVVVEVVGLFV